MVLSDVLNCAVDCTNGYNKTAHIVNGLIDYFNAFDFRLKVVLTICQSNDRFIISAVILGFIQISDSYDFIIITIDKFNLFAEHIL